MAKSGRVAIAELVSRGKEQLVLIRPYRKGLVLHTMTRSGLWRQNYLQTRNCRILTEEELVRELARFTLEEFFTIGEGKIVPNTAGCSRDYLGQKLEGLITECELRFVDMRKVAAQMDLLVDQRLSTGSVADFLRRNRGKRTTDDLGK